MKNQDMNTTSASSNAKYIPYAIAIGLVVISGVAYSQYSSMPKDQEKSSMTQEPATKTDAMMKQESPTMMKQEAPADAMMIKEPATKTDAMMKQETPVDAMIKNEASTDAMMIKKETGYQAYSDSTLAAALKADQKVYVFFHASWCPPCRALDADILANLSKIPANTLILKADYDSETALKQKYGVTVQTTVISLNTDGTLAKKTLSVPSLSELLK